MTVEVQLSGVHEVNALDQAEIRELCNNRLGKYGGWIHLHFKTQKESLKGSPMIKILGNSRISEEPIHAESQHFNVVTAVKDLLDKIELQVQKRLVVA